MLCSNLKAYSAEPMLVFRASKHTTNLTFSQLGRQSFYYSSSLRNFASTP